MIRIEDPPARRQWHTVRTRAAIEDGADSRFDSQHRTRKRARHRIGTGLAHFLERATGIAARSARSIRCGASRLAYFAGKCSRICSAPYPEPGSIPGTCNETSPAPHRHRARIFSGAGDGNRTRVISLEGWGSTIELRPHMVGTTGFEPAASCSQSTRATRLRHVPTSGVALYGFWRVRATGEWVESATTTPSERQYTCCVCVLVLLSQRAATPAPIFRRYT